MSQFFSPKDVAAAIGVSESSLKRWVDKGLIRASKTAGGHRRMEMDSIMQYLRNSGRMLERPEILELPSGCGSGGEWNAESARQALHEALVSGDEDAARRVVLDLYLGGMSVAELSDEVIARTFHKVGDLWECGELEVYEERRACELCQRVVHELRRVVGSGPGRKPLAMGGTLDGDPYTLATSLAELVLRDAGWKAVSLGNMLPFEAIRHAVLEHRPNLLWISVSSIRDVDRFSADFNLLFDVAHSTETALVVGGKALTADIRMNIRYSQFSDNFRHLESFANIIRQGVNGSVGKATR